MSKAIGFRVEPTAVHWALINNDSEQLILEEHATIKAPKGDDEGSILTWFRGRILNLVEQHAPNAVGIKYMEQVAKGGGGDSGRARARLEGVILQALHERGLRVFTGAYKAVSGQLGSRSAKTYLKADDVRGLDWSGVPDKRREAILVAMAALEE